MSQRINSSLSYISTRGFLPFVYIALNKFYNTSVFTEQFPDFTFRFAFTFHDKT